jgi:hypothetical protein
VKPLPHCCSPLHPRGLFADVSVIPDVAPRPDARMPDADPSDALALDASDDVPKNRRSDHQMFPSWGVAHAFLRAASRRPMDLDAQRPRRAFLVADRRAHRNAHRAPSALSSTVHKLVSVTSPPATARPLSLSGDGAVVSGRVTRDFRCISNRSVIAICPAAL